MGRLQATRTSAGTTPGAKKRPGDLIRILRRAPRLWRGFVVVALVSTGFALCRDYGVPWDEQIQRNYGQIVARYVTRGDPALFQHADRVYGPAHELVLLAAEVLIGARDMSDIVAVRHLVNFLTFVLGLAALYGLGRAGLGTRWAGGLTCVMLVLSPVIFAHAFFNSKDVPFLAWFIISVYSLLRFMERPGMVRALVHAAACAWLVAIRVPGILVPALTVVAVLHASLGPIARGPRTRLLGCFALYGIATICLTWGFWPTLWPDPLAGFWHALQTMRRFPWNGDVLFGGRVIPAGDLPWYYVPAWIAITTPVLYLVGFIIGLPVIIRRALDEVRRQNRAGVLFSGLVLAWLFVPLVSVVVFRSVLYDGWRQLFFVYPALLLIAGAGFQTLWQEIRDRSQGTVGRIAIVAAVVLAVGSMAGVVRFMIEAHPFQHVFFNQLIGGLPGARFKYDLDYWGLAYRRGLEAIARNDDDAIITVLRTAGPVEENARILPYADRRRMLFVESPDQAKYLLDSSRLQQKEYPYRDVAHRVEVAGVPILAVAVLHPEMSLTAATAPQVVAVRTRNRILTGAIGMPALRTRVDDGLRKCLAGFVRNARILQLETSNGQPEDLRSGHVDRLHIRIEDAEVGDFRHKGFGVPLARLDMTLGDVMLDLERLDAGEFAPALLDRVALGELVFDATAINAAMPRARVGQRNLRVFFDGGRARVESLASPRATATLLLRLAPDPRKPGSDNLWVQVETLHLLGWRIPLAWLLQLAVDRISPAIDPDELTARVELGRIEVDRQQLRLGTTVSASR